MELSERYTVYLEGQKTPCQTGGRNRSPVAAGFWSQFGNEYVVLQYCSDVGAERVGRTIVARWDSERWVPVDEMWAKR